MMLISVVVIVLCTIAIWWCSEMLSHGTDTLGKVYNISPGVRGATLDAVASSFPEFCAVVFALIAGHFDAGVGVVAGSALFNILIIPALASLVVGGLTVRSEIVKRDGLIYVAVVAAFILIFYFGAPGDTSEFRVLPAWSGFAAIIAYTAYVALLLLQSKNKERAEQPQAPQSNSSSDPDTPPDQAPKTDDAPTNLKLVFLKIVMGMAGVGVACHFLVEYGLKLVTGLGFSPAVAGVTILAAATSLPDTLLSVFAAKRGDADGAIANAFASNTFDILICLGLPILISGGLQMNWDDGWPILLCLLISTFAAVLLMITDWKITRAESIFKIALYLAFCVSIFMGWL